MSYQRFRPLFRNAGRLAAVGASLILGTIVTMSTASAGHGDNGSAISYDRDNNNQSVERINVTQAGSLACGWGLARLDNTEVDAHWPGNNDIRCRDGDYNKPWLGITSCTNVSWHNFRCDIYGIRFDLDYGRTVDSAWERRWYRYIGCHEFGHTSSVGHRASDTDHNSCMRNGHGHIWFDRHDHTAINRDR